MFKAYYMKSFPEKLKTKLQHLAFDNKLSLSRYIIKILTEHVISNNQSKEISKNLKPVI